MNNAARILITLGTLLYGIAPLIADLNASHVLNPDWPPHSRLHMVWLLATNTSLAALSLFLVWKRGQVVMAGVLGVCVIGGFWVAAATLGFYGGALSDMGGIGTKILGLEGNAVAFGIGITLLAAGLVTEIKSKSQRIHGSPPAVDV